MMTAEKPEVSESPSMGQQFHEVLEILEELNVQAERLRAATENAINAEHRRGANRSGDDDADR